MPGAAGTGTKPPSVVATMVPPSPTAQPCVASAKATLKSAALRPELCALQVAPASVVARMAALPLTTQAWVASLQATAWMPTPAHEACRDQLDPPSTVA